MRTPGKDKMLFFGFLVSVVVVFFVTRPLNSPWHPFIAGDGLGYYSYLPAKFIYNDKDLSFKWFNEVHNKNYQYSTFQNPEDNLLVQYGDRRINKYYQGLSFIWMPFFFAGHLFALISSSGADGFSTPYQLAMAIASLFYLLLGLIFLRRLIIRMTGNHSAGTLIPAAVFYGTWLFTYAISANTLSHAYSFSFLTMFLYYAHRFFNEPGQRTRDLLLCVLMLVISVLIRPLTGLIVLTLPALVPPGFFKNKIKLPALRVADWLIIILIFLALYHSLSITKTQTGSFFAYTYTNERFDFANARFFEALFSYHTGLFVYVPLILVSLAGIFFLFPYRRLVLVVFFFSVLFLYSAWWYWPIVKRALIDFYAIPAILLSFLFINTSGWVRNLLMGLVVLCVIYFQFKSMQVRRGILDENATYSEVFWRNFFRTTRVNQYLIPPHTILAQEVYRQDFESGVPGPTTAERAVSGNSSLLVDSANYICRVFDLPFPSLFSKEGFQKIRFSFHVFFEEGISSTHVFFQFFDQENKMLREVPFYLNAGDIQHSRWDYKEFGYELVDVEELNQGTVSHIGFTIWNVEGRKKLVVDDAKVEFILTDRSFETIK
jgi:hypothetical protein